MNTTKQFSAFIALLLIIGVVYVIWKTAVTPAPVVSNNNGGNEQVICTADAFQCADGSWVGRTGPNCQFVCSNVTASSTPEKNSATVTVKIAQKVGLLTSSIMPLKVVEDSRCPEDVQCIQAGTVRVQATLMSANGTATQTFTLNKPITTESETITLTAVRPSKKSTVTIAPQDYVFTFTVTRR